MRPDRGAGRRRDPTHRAVRRIADGVAGPGPTLHHHHPRRLPDPDDRDAPRQRVALRDMAEPQGAVGAYPDAALDPAAQDGPDPLLGPWHAAEHPARRPRRCCNRRPPPTRLRLRRTMAARSAVELFTYLISFSPSALHSVMPRLDLGISWRKLRSRLHSVLRARESWSDYVLRRWPGELMPGAAKSTTCHDGMGKRGSPSFPSALKRYGRCWITPGDLIKKLTEGSGEYAMTVIARTEENSVKINMRVARHQPDLIDRAAQATGKTRTEFML